MKYVIYYPFTQKYLSFGKNCDIYWVDEKDAHLFDKKQSVDNFLRHNFHECLRAGISRKDIIVIPKGNKGAAAMKAAQPPKKETKPEKEEPVKDPINEEQADKYVQELLASVDGVCEAGRLIEDLISYYASQVSISDKAQEDLLHKIEFTNANAVEGFKLYKALHDLRVRRRKYKNTYDILIVLSRGGFVDNLTRMNQDVTSRQAAMEKRIYVPRVLNELFTGERKENAS